VLNFRLKLNQSWMAALMAGAVAVLSPVAAGATESAADAGIDAPDEDIDEAAPAASSAFSIAGIAPQGESEYRAIFKAWRQLDTGLPMSSAVVVPSRKPIESMSLSSPFGMRIHPVTGKWRRHNGIDIPAPHGTPIYATADGIVGRAQRLGGYGLYVEVEHGNGIQTRFGHMSSFVVTPGQKIKAGDVIGYVGSTGRSTGNHLHYEVRIAGEPVNPSPFVQAGETNIASVSAKGAAIAMGGPEE
jgi:murein DD-endopeptidase MepM/ murein hydrolase activator NlpD